MPKRELERTVQQSVLDRLIDGDPRSPADVPISWAQSVRELKEALRRDLEWLLNTRRIPALAPEALQEVGNSLYHYGLPDITSLSADAHGTRAVLIRQVEEALELFEPRLTGVRVGLVETEYDDKRELRFLIEGLLKMEPSPEQVAFDTVLEISSGKFQVR
jgi:type VI secretion system protein ImpF